MRLLVLLFFYLLLIGAAAHWLAPTPGSLLDRARMVARGLASERGELQLAENKITALEVRNQLLEKADKLRELRATPEDKRGENYAAELKLASNEVLDLNGEFECRASVERFDAQHAAWEHALAEAADPEKRGANGPAAAFAELMLEGRKTAGTEFTSGEGFEEWRASKQAGEKSFESEIRTLLTSGVDQVITGTDAGVWRPVGQPVPPPARQQRLFVRDVLNVIETGLSAIPYIRELNPATTETGATAIGEGVTKPEVAMTFEQDTAIIKKIAAWIPATEEIIEDAPTLRGYIDTRLAYMLALREEAQVLNGSGNGPNIKGIRQFTVQTQATVNTEYPATIGKAIAKLELVDGEGDFVATNPSDFWVAVTTRHSTQFDGGFGLDVQPAPVGPVALYVPTWGLNTVRTRSMEAGKALVGSRMGATIADRMRTTIRVGNQHSTFFVENKVAILAEERIGLLVHRPDLFVEATVPTS